jgi:DNA-binding LacI/PurR family transcriptional regulator
MKLRSLKIHGFKSFADATVIDFHEGITAVVGPNGCGKSNISDAIRWVLGEQRPSAIRGGKMEEAIFQGSLNRRPVNRGSVTMVVSNEDGRLPVSFEEVEIGRTVYRDGGSDYSLNRSSCRLRDVVDLCRGTGLGANAYSVIENRMIDAANGLIDSKVEGVFYYPAELTVDLMKLNRKVIELLVTAGIQVVLIDRDIVSYPERSEFTRIGYDNRRGGVLLTNHLFSVGCKRIAFVGIPEISTVVANRLSGYHEAHRAHGMAVDPTLIHVADEVDLTESFCQNLVETCQPDAIIGKMDRYAAIIGRHLMAMGVEIGRDIKLAGFDDEPIAELLPVPLTTIRLPVQVFAQMAFEALLRRIADNDSDVGQLIVDTELIIRGSTTRPD